jgi:hypothetical protein
VPEVLEPRRDVHHGSAADQAAWLAEKIHFASQQFASQNMPTNQRQMKTCK